MSDRISIVENNDELNITIKALKDEKKQQLLLVWIVLFSICGILIFSQFFGNYDKSSKIFFAIYIAFWLFFEFKVIYAYRWRKTGSEKIILTKEELILIKEIGKRGITQKYSLEEVKHLGLFKSQENAFFKSINTSYWNINNYSLSFSSNNILVPFAIDLDGNQSKKILKKIQAFIQVKPS